MNSCATLDAMKIAPLATLLCVLPLAGCYVVQYPGGALTLSPTPTAPQAMRAAPGSIGSTDVTTAPIPTPNVVAAPVRATPPPQYPNGSPVPPDFEPGNGSPVPPDYRPQAQPAANPRYPNYPNGSPVPPDYVPPPSSRAVPGGAASSAAYVADPAYATYPAYSSYPVYPAYPAYATYPVAYPAYPAYAPVYPAFAPSPWLSNVSFSVSWGRGWGGWGGRCCHRWR
ncbi:hypothetical protein [Pandoraea sp. ISTKB]|uniref:hypothetical protein n=1 Tax=Pandoraea sp. ISTKB TaxID=1586708 RepID=UPI001112F984|nr:hypothetical protein [Pandoraea sp. ISTKB]